MKFLMNYLKEYKKESILAPVFKMMEAIFELLVPLVMASIIDVGIANRDTAYVIRMSLVLVLLAVVGLSFAITAQYFAAKAAIFSATKMRQDLFFHIMDMSAESHSSQGSSALITRITSDINQLQNGINMFLRLFLRSPFIVFGAMIMAWTIRAKAAIIFMVVILLLSLVVYGIMKSTLPIFATVQKKLEKVFLAVGENLEGARVIRAFGNQEEQLQDFRDKTGSLYEDQMHAGKISALLNPVTYVLVNLGIVLLLWVGADWVGTGILAKGEVVALVNYMSQILVELIKLANLIVILMRCVPSVGRVAEVMEMKADQRQTEEKLSAKKNDLALKFEDVSFCYPGSGEPALSHISFQVGKHERIGIIGGTGSGKSSLLQLMMHAYDATSGEITLFGEDVSAYTDGELAERIGMVFQKAVLFTGTIRENIAFGRDKITEQDIWDALHWAQAKDIVEAKTNGLDEEVLQGARNFSGGQRQRLTIARSLAGKPDLILLDDASSALDAATDAKLRKDLSELPWKPTVVIVSQRASSVMDADHILVLDNGECVGWGTHSELLQSNEVYREIYHSQFPEEDGEQNE